VHAVCPIEQLDETVDRYVRELLQAPPRAVAAAKQLIRRVAGHDPASVAGLTSDIVAERRVLDEGRAGMRDFLEKQTPPWVK
jgi:methylglutaconyl-CoA hydratase